MKKIPFCCAFLMCSIIAYNQNVGIGTANPDNSAQLDIVSTSRGLLIPRMTTAQRTAIASPAQGLMVFDTNISAFMYYTGFEWRNTYSFFDGWSLTGNDGTNPSINFIGTGDNQPLNFVVNNMRAGYLDVNGNAFWGQESGIHTISGKNNTAIGKHALYSNSDGDYLVAIGDNALFNNIGSTYNTAVGIHSLYKNTTGMFNTANGYYSLSNNTTGERNTANGYHSLEENTTGSNNTANGYRSLFSNTTGERNTANGSHSLFSNTTGTENTASGYESLSQNTTGSNNTANGFTSLFRNTTGKHNTAYGSHSLSENTTGEDNTALGSASLLWNTTGSRNMANGVNALSQNTTGSSNTASGSSSIYNNTTGSYNTAHGYFSLSYNTIGEFNTSIGFQSGMAVTDGGKNTLIGAYANTSNGSLSNTTALGYGAIVDVDNKVRIGNSFVTAIEGQVAFSFPSDARFKYDIKKDVPGLDFITKLEPVTYYFDNDKLDRYTKTGEISNTNIHPVSYTGNKQLRSGFLAQDVEKTARELGYDFDGIHKPENDKGHYSLAYSQFVVPLVKAVQEQQKIIESLERRIEKLERLINNNLTQK